MITYTARTQNYQLIIQCGKSSIVISSIIRKWTKLCIK